MSSLLDQTIGEKIIIARNEEQKILLELKKRGDPEAKRILRFLDMPDLSRQTQSPLNELIKRIVGLEYFRGFDVIDVPEIVRADLSFDPFNFPPDHPARLPSDTYFPDKDHILRTHTTIMWHYYLREKSVKQKIAERKPFGAFSYGKVYRKDEIDRHHMNIFHQMDGWYLIPNKKRLITLDDLRETLTQIAHAIYGPSTKVRFNHDTFPYTDPSLEMEIEISDKWIEVLGGGLVRPVVLKNLGMDPVSYNGWAFGFGLERLAIVSMELPDIRLLWSRDPRVTRQLRLENKFKEVSKFPQITRDISFIVKNDFVPNNYFDLIRDIGGNLVEEVKLLDRYENKKKFGPNKISYTYRIIYRSNERTLLTDEIDPIQTKIYQQTAEIFHAELR